MEFLTDFADEAVILPLAVVVAVMIAALGWWRGAAAWTIAVGGVLGAMGVLKAVFHVCAGPLEALGIHSPSGHTAASAVTYGGIVLLLGRGRAPPPVLVAAPVAIATLIGISRLALHAHTLAEVALGGAVGLCGAAVLLPLAGPKPPLRRWPVLAGGLAVLLVFHGLRLQAEQTIHVLATLSWLPLTTLCRA